MFASGIIKTSNKPKMGFSIEELLGRRENASSPKSDSTEINLSAPDLNVPIQQYVPYDREDRFVKASSNVLDGYTSPPYAAQLPNQYGVDYLELARNRYPYLQRCESVGHPHLRAPLPVMVSRESQHIYPWLLNRHIRILPHKFQGADAFLYHPFRKPKRIRTAFSPTELLQLEHAFEKNHYVVGRERKALAQALNLSETQVKVWFQNRRTKHKRQKQDDQGCELKGKDFLDSKEHSYFNEEVSSSEKSSPPPKEIQYSKSQSNCSSPKSPEREALWSPDSLSEMENFHHSELPNQYSRC